MEFFFVFWIPFDGIDLNVRFTVHFVSIPGLEIERKNNFRSLETERYSRDGNHSVISLVESTVGQLPSCNVLNGTRKNEMKRIRGR